jgi:RimJ/RimL family protein N-acetyltransferase
MSRIIFKTERLYLREVTHADADDLAQILCDPETMHFYPRPLRREEVDEWIDRNLDRYAQYGHGLWAVILNEGKIFVGDCGLIYQEVDGIEELEVGYQFNKNYWGRGLATEAARGCMNYAFSQLGRRRIISMIRPENLPSRRVAERNGLQIEKKVFWRGFHHYVYAANFYDWTPGAFPKRTDLTDKAG